MLFQFLWQRYKKPAKRMFHWWEKMFQIWEFYFFSLRFGWFFTANSSSLASDAYSIEPEAISLPSLSKV